MYREKLLHFLLCGVFPTQHPAIYKKKIYYNTTTELILPLRTIE